MKSFNVINYNINSKKFEPYDVIPHLVDMYLNLVENNNANKDYYYKVPKTFDEFKTFVKRESMYQWWSRCQYEIILTDWPCKMEEEKWDIYDQVMMNIDLITQTLIESINGNS